MAHIHLNQAQINALLNVAATVSGTTKTISGAVALNGLVELTATAHGYSTGNMVLLTGIVGTTEANGIYTLTVVDANHFTIPVTFTNAYTSGGTAALVTPQGTVVAGNGASTGGFTALLRSGDLYNLHNSTQRISNAVNSVNAIGVSLAVAP